MWHHFKALFKAWRFRWFQVQQFFCVFFFFFQRKIWSIIPCWKQRSFFDQVSKFDWGRIVAHQDCGLSFREIGRRVGRNQTTVMWICDRWIQEGMMDRLVQLHPPQCITTLDDRPIVCMAVMDNSATSQTIAQHIQSVMHHPVSALTIQRHLRQRCLSTRHPLRHLPLMQNC